MTGSRIIIVIYDVQAYERRTGKARKSWEKARKSPGEKPEIKHGKSPQKGPGKPRNKTREPEKKRRAKPRESPGEIPEKKE